MSPLKAWGGPARNIRWPLANIVGNGIRTRLDDLRDRGTVSTKPHIHFHEHGSIPRHAHYHSHDQPTYEHAHCHLTTVDATMAKEVHGD